MAGFTLVELMVVLAIFSLLAVFAVPSVLNRMPDYRIERVSSRLAAQLRSSRMGAMASGSRAYIRFINTEQTYTIWHDFNDDLIVDDGELEEFTIPAGTGVTFQTAFASRGYFNPGGFFETQGSLASFLAFVVTHPDTARQDILYIWPSGQVTLHRQ